MNFKLCLYFQHYMESQVSEILENVLGLLGLEGSFEVNEEDEQVKVTIDTDDAGRLIGFRGETLDALQLLVNQMAAKKVRAETSEDAKFKRVIVDVSGWRQNKEGDLTRRAKSWAEKVIETGEDMELEPMPAWQRRVVHLAIEEISGVSSESVGEGRDRHLVLKAEGPAKKTKKSEEVNSDSDQDSPTESLDNKEESTEEKEVTKEEIESDETMSPSTES